MGLFGSLLETQYLSLGVTRSEKVIASLAVGAFSRKNQLVEELLGRDQLTRKQVFKAELGEDFIDQRMRSNFKRHLIVKVPPVKLSFKVQNRYLSQCVYVSSLQNLKRLLTKPFLAVNCVLKCLLLSRDLISLEHHLG